jgi:hypothetical protein
MAIEDKTIIANSCVLHGQNYKVIGDGNIVYGENLEVQGDSNTIHSSSVCIQGVNNVIIGRMPSSNRTPGNMYVEEEGNLVTATTTTTTTTTTDPDGRSSTIRAGYDPFIYDLTMGRVGRGMSVHAGPRFVRGGIELDNSVAPRTRPISMNLLFASAGDSQAMVSTSMSTTPSTRPAEKPPSIDEGEDELCSEESKQCVVCMDNRIKALVLPCAHACLCLSCAGKIRAGAAGKSECPICRKPIQDVMKIFLK